MEYTEEQDLLGFRGAGREGSRTPSAGTQSLATPVCPSILLYLFPERFVPYREDFDVDAPDLRLPVSRIPVSSSWLAVESLTVALWYLRRQGIISLQPYIRGRSHYVLRSIRQLVRNTLQPEIDHSIRSFDAPPPRVLITCRAGAGGAGTGIDGLERELWATTYAMHRQGDLRVIMRRWFAGALDRVSGFEMPSARFFLRMPWSIRDADHRVLWTIENAAIAHGYLHRLPPDTDRGIHWHDQYAFPGAFGRMVAVNPAPVEQLIDNVIAFEEEWNAFRNEGSGLYHLLREQCGRELERAGPS